jgi:hypothetical protein
MPNDAAAEKAGLEAESDLPTAIAALLVGVDHRGPQL